LNSENPDLDNDKTMKSYVEETIKDEQANEIY
jgi:hypothetical protein